MNPRLALIALIALPFLPGCDEPTPKKAAPPKTRPILNERTQDIRETKAEVKKGAVVAPPRVVAKDPYTLAGNVYVSAIGQTAIGNIKHTVDLYHAETGEFPKSHAEFMEQIIKKNNIALPVLPSYQEYSYDVNTHQLNIIEYPDKKAALGR